MTIAMVANIRRVALIVTAIWFGLSGSIALAAAVGQFQFVSGDVRVQRAGQTLTATKGNEVQEGDVIVTGSPADAQLRMIDSAFIAIKANSQLRIDQYTYRPANASEDNAVLSLLVGTMRAFTGALVQRNKDKFSMKTLTANVGIRGSGNILSAAADGTTLNYTITGAHSVSSTDADGITRTLISRAGQTIQVLPGRAPQYVPTPPLILSLASPPKSAAKASKGDSDVREKSSADSDVAATPATTAESVVATALASDTQRSVQQASIQSSANALVRAQFSSVAEAAAFGQFSIPLSTGYAEAIFQHSFISDPFGLGVPGSTFKFDLAGNLVSISHGFLYTFIEHSTLAGFIPAQYDDASITFRGGVAQDNYRDTANQIVMGRWQGGSIDVVPFDGKTQTPLSFDLGARSVEYAVFRPTDPAVSASFTGTTSYVLAGSTRPTDSLGNVGVLNSAFVNANFTSHAADFGVNFSINNQTINLAAASIPFGMGNQYFGALGRSNSAFRDLSISCSGSNCNSLGYEAEINGTFAGVNGGAVVINYDASTLRNNRRDPPPDNIIFGQAALTASSLPTVGVILPLTGTALYTLSNLSATDPRGTDVQFSAHSGQLNANFTARTVDTSISFTPSQSNQSWTASATAAPIHGVGFAAQLGGGTVPAGMATLNVSCTGSGCPASTAGLAGRFDGFFTGQNGSGANVQYIVGTNAPGIALAFYGNANFVRSSAPVATPADPLVTAALVPSTGGLTGTLSRIDRVQRLVGSRFAVIR